MYKMGISNFISKIDVNSTNSTSSITRLHKDFKATMSISPVNNGHNL